MDNALLEVDSVDTDTGELFPDLEAHMTEAHPGFAAEEVPDGN